MLQSPANADPGPLRGDINCGADQYFNTELQQCFAGQRPSPVADAGEEQAVESGQPVTLHGGASNTLGETVSYIWDVLPDTDSAPYVNSLWTQLINSPDSQSPTLTAPTLENGAPDLVLTFSLTVRVSGYGSDDDFLESAPTTVQVTVRAPHEAAAPPPPALSLVEPGHGAVSGGTSIAITGENLNGTTGVTIGGMPAGFTIVDDTTLNVVTPKGPSAGLTSIIVTTAGGSETIAFTYDLLPQDGENALVVSTPSGSTVYGGTMAVSVSGGKGSGALSLAGTQGVCDVGDLTDNLATITATGLGTCTIAATKAADATYAAGYATARIEITAPQLLTTANPDAASVAFKVGNQITPFTPISASGGLGTLSFTVSPALPAGLAINAVTGVITGTPSVVAPAANFIVTVTDQSPTPQTSSKPFNLQVVAPLPVTTITSVSPASGETIGGTALTISGANFTGATAVSIGGVAAASFKVNSDTSISANAPGHVAGAVDVVVTVPTGPVTATQAFTYVLAPQTITFGSLPDTGINETPPALSATASSTLVVSYVSKTTGICTIGSGTVGKRIINFVAVGDCSITVNQAGNGFYESADPVTRTFKIIPPPRENINTKPVVNAGEDKTIYSDETIQFLATASDGDNDPLTYQWEVVGEPAGQLTGASLLGVSYHAPHLQPGSDNLVLTFKLTVTDGKDSVSDTVNVTVKPQSGSGKGSLTVAGGATDIVPTGPVTLTFNYAPMTDHSSLGSLTMFGAVSPMVDLLQLATVNTGVTFYDGDVVLCANVTLVNNKASCTVSLAPGPHNLRAVYNSGEVSVEPASDTLIVTAVDKAGPSATAIGSFLSDRANLIVTNLPGMDRQVDRLNAAQSAKGGLDTSSNLAASGKGDLLLSDKGDLLLSEKGDLLPLEKGDLLLNTTRLGSGPSGASITASRLGVSSGTEFGSTNVGQQGLLGFQSFLYNYLRSSGESGNFGHFNFSGPMDMQANFNSGSSQASFKTSLAQMMAWQQHHDHNDMASLGFGTGRAPDYFMPFDMWMEGVYSSYSGTRSGTFGMVTAGADYVFNPSFLVGFYGQFDAMAQSTAPVEGKGWMTGPYVTARIGENVFWQGRAGWGKSSNTINLDGSGADNFGSSRWLVSSSLSGKWRWGDGLAFAPTASFSYFEDKSDGYVDHFGVNIPGVKTNLGQFKLSPELSYGFLKDNDLWIEPSLATELIWNFASTNVDGVGSLDGDATGPAGLRGRVKAGLNIRMPSGILLGASGVYDGIGSGNYSAIAGQITVTVPLN